MINIEPGMILIDKLENQRMLIISHVSIIDDLYSCLRCLCNGKLIEHILAKDIRLSKSGFIIE